LAERAGRPLALSLDGLKPFHEAAYIECDARQFRPDCLQRAIDGDARGHRTVGQFRHAAARSLGPARQPRFPRCGDARLKLAAGEIRKKPLAGGDSDLGQERTATPVLQTRKTGQRRFLTVEAHALRGSLYIRKSVADCRMLIEEGFLLLGCGAAKV
jgi:hypothetical protein